MQHLDINDPGNWPEDFHLENGNYQCRCHKCDRAFIGYKRRTTCKVCATAEQVRVSKLTAEELAKEQADRQELIKSLFGGYLPAVGGKPNPFSFQAPNWVNTRPPDDPQAALGRAMSAANLFYPLAQQTGIHAMIEWCGVMVEYVHMLEEVAKAGQDPREVDKHHSTSAEIPDFMIEYFCSKLGCQLIPFIKANPAAWQQQFNGWVKEAIGPITE